MIRPVLTTNMTDLVYLFKQFNFLSLDAWPFIQGQIDSFSPHERTYFRGLVYKEVNRLWGTALIDFGIPLGNVDGYQIHYPMPEFVITYKGKEVCRC
jgi:hypothetical protein